MVKKHGKRFVVPKEQEFLKKIVEVPKEVHQEAQELLMKFVAVNPTHRTRRELQSKIC